MSATVIPAISVVMSVYNGGPHLSGAIRSILAQTHGDFEFLILDDGSTDPSRQVIAAHARADHRIRLIARENRGLVASLNELLDAARAPLIARMDADDLCAPERLARQLAFLRANPGYGIVGTDCDHIGLADELVSRPDVERPISDTALRRNLESGPLLHHPSVMFSRRLVVALGGYRDAFTHAEDYDLWLRLSAVTCMANLPEKLLSYRVHDQQVSQRHMITQARNAAIAWLCHRERHAGREDPVSQSGRLPETGRLDRVFGDGAEDYVRRRVVERSLYAPEALNHEGWSMLTDYARSHADDKRLWRLVARMARSGSPLRAGRLGMALMAA